jgi:hypothetical protein
MCVVLCCLVLSFNDMVHIYLFIFSHFHYDMLQAQARSSGSSRDIENAHILMRNVRRKGEGRG